MGQSACAGTPCFAFTASNKKVDATPQAVSSAPGPIKAADDIPAATATVELSRDTVASRSAEVVAASAEPDESQSAPLVNMDPPAVINTDPPMDISAAQNRSFMKYCIEPSPATTYGEEGVQPTDGARVEVLFAWRALKGQVEDFPDPRASWVGEPQRVAFVLGNCEHCDAFESALAAIRKGETMVVRCGANGAGDVRSWMDETLGLLPVPSGGALASFAPVDMWVKLLWCEKELDVMDMTTEARLKYGNERKDAAAKYFKAERYTSALHKYKLVADVLSYTQDIKDAETLDGTKTTRRLAKLNEAACCLKLQDFAGVIPACTEVLREQPQNEKALFRRASAYQKLGDCALAEADLKRCVNINPQNKEARRLLTQCREELKQSGSSQKDVFAKMLGTDPDKKPDPSESRRKLEKAQRKLQEAIAAKNTEGVRAALGVIEGLLARAQELKYEDLQELKVGKDVGNAMRMGDEALSVEAQKVVRAIQAVAKRQDQGF